MGEPILNESSDKIERFIEFTLGKENFGIPLLLVREVISVPETTPLPNIGRNFFFDLFSNVHRTIFTERHETRVHFIGNRACIRSCF